MSGFAPHPSMRARHSGLPSIVVAAALLTRGLAPGSPIDAGVDVEIDRGQAEAVLAILDARAAREPVTEELWRRVFTAEGYRRLKERELSMGRSFDDEEFRAFVLSADLLERRAVLRATLAEWSRVDVSSSAEKVLRYLPADATIRATIYPAIKPQTNSFVFDLDDDPAIFFYLDPDQSAGVFENTMAHELHHVGLAAACPGVARGGGDEAAEVRRWIGAFGEGLAMLAAAGGPDVHPHAASPAADRERWDRDVGRFDEDLERVEGFFLDVLEGRLANPEERLAVARSFYGVQGPWYTVGWRMAVTIERARGREALLSVLCDPVGFLSAYNEAAPVGGARWSPELLARLATPAAPR